MSRNCLVCGKKLGILNAKTITSDGALLCLDDTNKLFGETTGKEHIGIKPTYASWVQKHTSAEIKDLISKNQTAILIAPDRCIGCGRKINAFKATITKDNKRICSNCIHKVFKDQNDTVNAWINNHDSDYFLAYFKNDRSLKAISKDKAEGETLFCPCCNSENVKPLGADRKAFSVGKAAAGAALTGGLGLLAGFAGKKTGMTDFVCMNCGKQFKK